MRTVVGLLCLFSLVAGSHPASASPDRVLQERIGYDQRIGNQVPNDLAFADSKGDPVRLADLTADRPTVLVLAWYDCKNLCGFTLRALAEAVAGLPFALGKDYRVVTVSIDPTETPVDAAASRRTVLALAGQPDGDGWRFLVGREKVIAALAQAVGFRYGFDAETRQYAHPVGLVLLEPGGRVSRYLFGMRFPPRDLRLALVETGRGELGSVIDQIALRCHRFDPETGRYSLAVLTLLQVAGGGSATLLFGLVGWWWWRERRDRSKPDD